MLKKLLRRIDETLSKSGATEASVTDREEAVRIATAALLVEVAKADFNYAADEFETLTRLIETQFVLTPEEALTLTETAGERVEESVSLHEFTALLHRSLAPDEKSTIVAMMWRLAYADGRLDMYEDALILKVADLLYVPRVEVMRHKARAAESQA